MKPIPAILAAALAALLPAHAAEPAAAQKAIADFIAAPGFETYPPDTIDGEGSLYLERFDGGGEALRPDAMVGPIEKAMLLVESFEASQPERVRYAVSYGQVVEADGQGTVNFYELVEVRRYNMGPLIHRSTQQDYGPENTAPVEDFGVGPDVVWRFAFMPLMGNLAAVEGMSRKQIGDGDAQLKVDEADLCPTRTPCRELEAGVYVFDLAEAGDPKAERFKDVPVPDIGKPTYSTTRGKDDMKYPSAALMVRWMGTLAGLTEPADASGQWRMPETPEGAGYDLGKPFVVFQMDQNMGQEMETTALVGYEALMDDSLSARWAKATAFGDQPLSGPTVQNVKR